MSRRLLALFASVFLVGGLLATSATAVFAATCTAGGTCYVSAAGNDGFDGSTPATAKQHINAGIAAAGANGTVIVAAGTYPEHVTANQTGQTIQGPHAGECRQDNPVASEAVITGDPTGAVQILANNVTFDGFQVSAPGNALGAGIWLDAGHGGYHIQNNLVTQNGEGIYANDNAPSWIYCNEIRDNNYAGPPFGSNGAGIYSDGGTNGLTIDDNEFQGHNINNPIIFGATAANQNKAVTISNNDIHGNNCDCSAVYLIAVQSGDIFGNDITSIGGTGGSADIRLGGNDTDIDINHNILHLGKYGVQSVNDGFAFGLNFDVHVNRNSLTNHTVAGVDNTNGQTAVLDAECNWWGAAEGPGTPPPAGQDAAGANIDFNPWLITSDLDGPCGPDLTIVKTNNGPFTPGVVGGSKYTITVTNIGGGTANAFTVNDTFPAGFTPTGVVCSTNSNPPTSCPTAGPYKYPAGLAPGQSETITVSGTDTQNGPSTQSNTATVTSTGETDTTNNSSTSTATVNGLPRLEVHKSHTPTNFRSPGFGAFFIDVFNSAAASSPTTGAYRVTDTMTSGVFVLAIIAPGWVCTPPAATFQCTTTAPIDSGQHAPAIVVIVGIGFNPPQALQNTATVSGGEGVLPFPAFGNATPVFMTTTDRVQITRWFHFF
jgi:hypothetical protein